jgi:hypothetical protein
MRVMQSAADANKMLVEIKTDGKPLRFCRPVQAVVADGDRRDRGTIQAGSELDRLIASSRLHVNQKHRVMRRKRPARRFFW